MRVLITGASGFIGRALTDRLSVAGHEPIALRRGQGLAGGPSWDPDAGVIDDGALEGVDAVVHLAGESIGGRWTNAKKQELLSSRTEGTDLMARAVAEAGVPVLISGSAIGYYGDRDDEVLTEEAPPGDGFLADLCVAWEAAAAPAVEAGVRTAFIRTSLVLDESGGSFPRMLLPFRLGAGGPLGGGRQWWAWITLEDEVRAIMHCLEHDIGGPVNLSSPEPIRNTDFGRELGKAMHRPAVLPAPAFGLKLLLGGQFAEEVLLASQRVVPRVLEESGFEFAHPTLGEAFEAIFGS